MDIILCNTSDEAYKLNKKLVDQNTVSGTLRSATDVINPVITFEHTSNQYLSYNYAFIPIFDRYYFVQSSENTAANLWTLRLHVDVLMSFRAEISRLNVILDRAQVDYNDYYLNSENWIRKVKDKTDIINFPNGLLENGEFILITAGGGTNA